MSNDRITYDPDGVLDEVVLTGVDHVHIERMGNAQWWIGIKHKGQTLMVNLGAVNDRAKAYGHAEWDSFDGPPDGAPAADEQEATEDAAYQQAIRDQRCQDGECEATR